MIEATAIIGVVLVLALLVVIGLTIGHASRARDQHDRIVTLIERQCESARLGRVDADRIILAMCERAMDANERLVEDVLSQSEAYRGVIEMRTRPPETVAKQAENNGQMQIDEMDDILGIMNKDEIPSRV